MIIYILLQNKKILFLGLISILLLFYTFINFDIKPYFITAYKNSRTGWDFLLSKREEYNQGDVIIKSQIEKQYIKLLNLNYRDSIYQGLFLHFPEQTANIIKLMNFNNFSVKK